MYKSELPPKVKPNTDQAMAPANSPFQRMVSVSMSAKGKVTTKAAMSCTVL